MCGVYVCVRADVNVRVRAFVCAILLQLWLLFTWWYIFAMSPQLTQLRSCTYNNTGFECKKTNAQCSLQ